MFKWKKIATIILTVAMLATVLTVPAMADGDVIFTEGFENVAEDENDSILKANWSLENAAMAWKNDAENTEANNISITSEEGDVHSGSYALKMRTDSVVSKNVYTYEYNKTPGLLYKISGWVKMVTPGTGTADGWSYVCTTLTVGGQAGQGTGTGDFLTMGNLNPYAENKNHDGYFLQGTYNEWVYFTRYFVPSYEHFCIIIGANTRGIEGTYILWDDIEITKVNNVVFENTDGSAVEEIAGGTSFNGILLMGNTGEAVQNYVGMKALYERTSDNRLQLQAIETFPIEVPVRNSTYNTGQFRKDMTFDMSTYETGKDYVAKVFVWDSASGMHPVAYGVQE